MQNTARDLDRHLTLLRNRIRQRGFTQLEVQEALGWGRMSAVVRKGGIVVF